MSEQPKLNKKMPRKPMNRGSVLSATSRPGFVRRVVNDEEGRIKRFEEAGWTVVQGDNFTHTQTAKTESQMGSVCKKVVNKQPMAKSKYGYLMEIPEEYYNEDQKYKQQLREQKLEQLDPEKNQQPGSTYGKLTIT